MAFLVEVSGHKTVFSDLSFCLVLLFCTCMYPFYKMLIHEYTPVFLFRGFFIRVFKTREEYLWLTLKSGSRRDCEIAWSKRLESFVKLMSKNSISGVMVPSPSSVFFRVGGLLYPVMQIRIQSGQWIRRSGSRRAKKTNKKIEKS
jgi:hypothetical protein